MGCSSGMKKENTRQKRIHPRFSTAQVVNPNVPGSEVKHPRGLIKRTRDIFCTRDLDFLPPLPSLHKDSACASFKVLPALLPELNLISPAHDPS